MDRLTQHPGRDGCHALCVRGHVGHIVEDVDQDEEEGYKQGHSSRHNLKWGVQEGVHPSSWLVHLCRALQEY